MKHLFLISTAYHFALRNVADAATSVEPAIATNAAAIAATSAPTQEGAKEEPFKYEGERYTFGPAEMDKAEELAAKINASGVPVVQYPREVWPQGAGVGLIPLAKTEERTVVSEGKATSEKYRKTHAVLAWPVFPVEMILQAGPDAVAYLGSLSAADQMQRILGPLRKQDWANPGALDLSSIVDTLQAHIEGQQAGQGIVKAYNDAAIKLLPTIKKMHALFAHFTPQIMRQYLSSKALANAFSKEIEDKGFWVGLIDKLENVAKSNGAPTDIFQQWRETRDEATIDDLDSIDLSKLA